MSQHLCIGERSPRRLLRRVGSRTAAVVSAVLLATGLAATGVVGAATPAGADTTICDQYGSATVSGGRFVVQNDRWNTSQTQCVSARDGGFTVTRADGSVRTDGPPKSYPSIYAGCHYGLCSSGSGLPQRASAVTGSAGGTIRTVGGAFDAAYDIWFDTSPTPSGQNDDTEIMIWLDHGGAPRPAGSFQQTVTVDGASWDLWKGRLGNSPAWNVVSFVRTTPTSSAAVNLKPFIDASVSRGWTNPSSYLTSVQLGTEPWEGGTGFAVDGFTWNPSGGTGGGGGGSTPAPRAIVNQGSNRCLDVNASGTADGTKVQLWDCYGNGAQGWTQRSGSLVNSGSGKCLDVSGGRTANGTIVQLWTCLDNDAQQWVVGSDGRIVNPHSGRCLDAAGRGTGNGTQMQIWDCNRSTAAPNQIFSLR